MKSKNYKLTIQYDGSDFHGWQVQAKERTVQGDIQHAFSAIYPKEKIILFGSGRTDAGVHALGQVAHIKLPFKFSAKKLQNALNGNLSKDIRIKAVEDVEDNFHARFSATAREYEYRMVKHFSPVTRNYTTPLKWEIQVRECRSADCRGISCGLHTGAHMWDTSPWRKLVWVSTPQKPSEIAGSLYNTPEFFFGGGG